MPKFTRRRLLAGAAPLVAAPVLGKLALDGNAEAAPPRAPEGHIHGQDAHGSRGDARWAGACGRRARATCTNCFIRPRRSRIEQGRVREYSMRAFDREIEVAPGVFFPAWTYNGTVPGPVIRATEGDTLRVRFVNAGVAPPLDPLPRHPSLGTWTVSSRWVKSGWTSSSMSSRPGLAGMHLYHCHTTPLKKHIHKGLYGAFIIEPEGAAAARRRGARHGHERLRHRRRRRATTSTPSTGAQFLLREVSRSS